jgi:molybdenum cofactor biosynthesis enzyme
MVRFQGLNIWDMYVVASKGMVISCLRYQEEAVSGKGGPPAVQIDAGW